MCVTTYNFSFICCKSSEGPDVLSGFFASTQTFFVLSGAFWQTELLCCAPKLSVKLRNLVETLNSRMNAHHEWPSVHYQYAAAELLVHSITPWSAVIVALMSVFMSLTLKHQPLSYYWPIAGLDCHKLTSQEASCLVHHYHHPLLTVSCHRVWTVSSWCPLLLSDVWPRKKH